VKLCVYLAGPMTAYPLLNHPAFDDATRRLRDAGYGVVSPAEIDRAIGIQANAEDPYAGMHVDPGEIMRDDLRAVLDADAIVLLPGWEGSKGARLERIVAESSGRRVFLYLFHPGVDRTPILQEVTGRWEHEAIWRVPAKTV
jgi:hypothetical protein